MKTINANTKAAARFIDGYNRSNMYDLYDCYGRFSCEKARAERWCKEQMYKENGTGFKIIGYNCMAFSCGWMTAEGLRVETAQNSYLIK